MKSSNKSLLQLHQRQRVLQILVFSLITIFFWVFLSLLMSQKKTKISAELKTMAVPLTPTIDEETITSLESKRFFSEDELAEFPIYKIITSEDGRLEKVVDINVNEFNQENQPDVVNPNLFDTFEPAIQENTIEQEDTTNKTTFEEEIEQPNQGFSQPDITGSDDSLPQFQQITPVQPQSL